MVGLSGLITPSLDEMVNVAAEMERRGMRIPLLIGGATTSKQHTAVKIAPAYSSSVTHVLDASRAVGVVSRLLDPTQRAAFERRRARGAGAPARPVRHPARAPAALLREPPARGGSPSTGDAEDLPVAGVHRAAGAARTCRWREIARYIDWTFFFHAWELRGKFPDVLDHPRHGAGRARAVRQRDRDARRADRRAARSRANGVYGLWPANADGDDIVLYADADRSAELVRFPMLRQQRVKADDKPPVSLADFVAPRESGLLDHVGAFAVTAGIGVEELARALRGATTTTTRRSWSRRSPTAWPRRSPRCSTPACGASGATAPRGPQPTRTSIAEALPRHPPGLRLPGLPRPPAQAPPVRAARRRRDRHDASPRAWPCCPPPR